MVLRMGETQIIKWTAEGAKERQDAAYYVATSDTRQLSGICLYSEKSAPKGEARWHRG